MRDIVQITREIALNLALLSGNEESIRLLQDRPFDCIARTVYAEARGEGQQGMSLVVQSILNRRVALDKTACEIARRSYDGFRLVQHRKASSFNRESWNMARLVTIAVVSGHVDLGDCSGVTHFLNPAAVRRMPNWASTENYICTVGKHHAYAIANI